MGKILSVNAGSSSLKFKMFVMPSEEVITEGVIERIGFEDAIFSIKANGQKHKKELGIKDHEFAVGLLINTLTELKIIESLDEITGVGHRVVHGGEVFKDSVLIDDSVVREIEQLNDLAPLHNPANIVGINQFKKALPNVPHVAVFDTSFHQSMEEEAFLYGTPYEWYTEHSVRKYGFHGTSHKFVSTRVREILSKDDAKVIVCHLGNGASLTAVDGDKSVDTTMGFTPLAGLLMGTRTGDIDPAIIPYIMKKTNQSVEQIEQALNKKSGLLGVSGISSDSRDIEDAIEAGNHRARVAQDIFVRRVVSYIASYHVLLGGADAIAFTAGIGENSATVRKEVMNRLGALGIQIDEAANNVRGEERLISTADSKIKCYIIPTNEEVVIARDVIRLSK
jgi:acetate kinase